MKKRILSLALCLCLCLSLIPTLALTAHAVLETRIVIDGYEFDPINGGDRAMFGGMCTVEITSDLIRIGLNNCSIGSSADCPGHDVAATPKSMGFYVQSMGKDVLLELDGENEIMSNFAIQIFDTYGGHKENSLVTIASAPGGSGKLTVNGEAFFYSENTQIKDAQFRVTGQNTMERNAMYVWGNLTVGDYSSDKNAKGGDGYEPGLVIDTTRPVGLCAESMNVYGCTSSIRAANVGMYLDNTGTYAYYTMVFCGGGLDLFGGQAAALFRLWGGTRGCEFETGFGELYDVPQCVSSTYPVGDTGFKFLSWGYNNPLTVSGDYEALNNPEYPFTCNAAKELYFGYLGTNPLAYVTFHADPYGLIDDNDGYIYAYEKGSVLGAMPVPVNKSFHTPGAKFDNMHFVCWIQDNDPMMPVSAATTVEEDMNLYAYFVEGQGGMPFTDVAESDWFYEAAGYAYGQGLISGTGSGTTFSPAMSCTRAMIVSILYRLEGQPTVWKDDNHFGDVPNGEWYTNAVIWANLNGIVAGDGTGNFLPNNNVTREQLARIMMMYADYIARKNPSASVGLNDYPDHGAVAGWAEPAVKWAVAMGLISGKPQGGKNYLDPQGTASRAEFASILMRFIKAFDGDRAFYASDLDWFCVFIPEMWNGHIQAQHTVTSFGECISFYLKDQGEAVPGTGRLFSLYFCPVENGAAYMELPHWQYLGAMQETENPSKQHFHVVLDLPTDVQMGMTEDPMLDQILIKLYNSIYEQRANALAIYGLQGLEFNAGVG